MRRSYIHRVAARDRHRLGSYKYYVRGRKVTVRSMPKGVKHEKDAQEENDQEAGLLENDNGE